MEEVSLDTALEAALRYVDKMVSEQPELAVFAQEAKRGLIAAAALARASADDDEDAVATGGEASSPAQ